MSAHFRSETGFLLSNPMRSKYLSAMIKSRTFIRRWGEPEGVEGGNPHLSSSPDGELTAQRSLSAVTSSEEDLPAINRHIKDKSHVVAYVPSSSHGNDVDGGILRQFLLDTRGVLKGAGGAALCARRMSRHIFTR